MSRKRRNHSSAFRAKVALAAIKGDRSAWSQYVDLLPEKLRHVKARKTKNNPKTKVESDDDAQLLTPENGVTQVT